MQGGGGLAFGNKSSKAAGSQDSGGNLFEFSKPVTKWEERHTPAESFQSDRVLGGRCVSWGGIGGGASSIQVQPPMATERPRDPQQGSMIRSPRR